MERIRIEYETGWMELNIEAFFPCTVQKARKVFPLISRYCSDADKKELLSILREMTDGYQALCDIYQQKASAFFWNEKQRKHWMVEYRKTDTLRKRMLKNIEVFKKAEKN